MSSTEKPGFWLPAAILTCVFVSLELTPEIWMAFADHPALNISPSFLLVSLLIDGLLASLVVLLYRSRLSLVRHPAFPIVWIGLIGAGVLYVVQAWFDAWVHSYLVVPVVLVLLTNSSPRSRAHREFRWLLLLMLTLGGPGLLKAFHMGTYQADGPSWIGLGIAVLLFVVLRLGGTLYARGLEHLDYRRPSVLLLVVGLVLGAGAFHLVKPSPPEFDPVLAGELEEPPRPVQKDLPNIILISVDTLRWDMIPPRSDLQLPHLRSLRRDSLAFTRVFSTASWTTPSHASLFSGLMPLKHGAVGGGGTAGMYDTVPLYTQYLKQLGYSTGGFTGGLLVRKELGFSRGYDRYWEYPLPYRGYVPGSMVIVHALAPKLAPNFHPQIRIRSFHHKRNLMPLRYFQTTIRSSEPWIEEQSQPLFLFLHTYQVHDWSRYYPSSLEALGRSHPALHDSLTHFTRRQTRDRAMYELYQFGIKNLDRAIGELVRMLKSRDLYENSYVIFLSDHGEGFRVTSSAWSHGRGQLQEVLIRIPLWVKFPKGRYGGETNDGLIQITDILPMIFESMDVPVPETFKHDPRNIMQSYLDSEGRPWVGGSVDAKRGRHPRFFVRTDKYKHAREADTKAGQFWRVWNETLGETEVAAQKVPEAAYRTLIEEMDRTLLQHRRGLDPWRVEDAQFDPRTRRALEGMGYID